jgi:hypothetical protein
LCGASAAKRDKSPNLKSEKPNKTQLQKFQSPKQAVEDHPETGGSFEISDIEI